MTVADTTFGTGAAAVEAYTVEPGEGPARAGVLFLHWLGDHRSDRSQFLSIAPMSAVELARAAPGEPAIEWYGADHAMRTAKARASRRAFLRRELGLD